MIRSLYTAVSGMITQEAKQDVISSNLANVNTVGFKQDNLGIRKFDDVLIQNYDKVVGGKNVRNVIGSLSLGSKIDAVDTDFEQGAIESTDKSTDFALEGRGFFTVQGTDGQYYTRDGHFHIDSRGFLVDDNGYGVMGRNSSTGALEQIYVGNSKIACDQFGNISLDGKPAYKMYTVDFNNYSSLTKVGNNLYEGSNPQEANVSIKQNCLEKSNVNVINEMIDMMTTMRTFETNQKVVQSIDDTLGKAVNDLGTVR